MKIINNLKQDEYKSIKESFFHIYHYYLNKGPLSKEYVTCLFKWGIQLSINEDEVSYYIDNENDLDDTKKINLLEHLYNLVYMIYLDQVVEDIELKVVSDYAETLGFDASIVNDLLKTIVTAPYDGYEFSQVKSHIQDVLESGS